MDQRTVINIFKEKIRNRPPIPPAVWYHPLYFIAFGLGSGVSPIAPGTIGTLFAIPCYGLLQALSFSHYLIFVICFIIISSLLCDYISRAIHIHDHPGMCIDEFAGFFVTMIHAPQGPQWILLGFLLFRLFDIWKPGPIRWIDDHLHNGWGMVLDDVVAGLFSLLIIQLLAFFYSHSFIIQ